MNRALAAVLFVLAASYAAAQEAGDSGSKVRVKRAVVDGENVVLDLRIEPSWHIYAVNAEGTVGNATKVSVDRPSEIAGPIVEPKPKHRRHEWSPDYIEEYDYHEGEIQIRIPVKGAGAGTVKGAVHVTACDANVCLQPGKVSFKAEPGRGAPTNGSKEAAPGPDSRGTGEHQGSPAPTTSRPSRKTVSNPKRLGKFDSDDPFKVVEISYPDPIRTDRFDVTVVVEVAPDFHIYGFEKAMTGVPTAVEFGAAEGGAPPVVVKRAGVPATDPKPKQRRKQFEEYDYFEGRATFKVPVRATWADGKPPEAEGDVPFRFRVEVDYQTCTMEKCLLPGAAKFDLDAIAVGGKDGIPAGSSKHDLPVKGVPSPGREISAKLSFEPLTLAPDKTGTLVTRLQRLDGRPLDPGNAEARIALVHGQGLFIEGKPTVTAETDGAVTLRVPIRVSADALDGTVKVSGRASLGAISEDFSGEVEIKAPLLGFLLIAMASALAALLTPCVFPMIPVTMSFFTKQAETGQQHPAKLATLYCIGIIGSFTAIGALFTFALGSGEAANQFAGHWLTQLVITALFIFFALSLLGMFDLSVPQPIMNLVERHTTKRIEVSQGGRGIAVGVLMMGLLFSVTTFTCTAPFVGGLLAGSSSSGHTRPVLGMLFFSIALAIPFFFLALFPSQLKKLPKAGGWLNETKVVMGFIELAAAIKFLNGADLSLGWGIITRNVNLALWIAIFGLTGLYLLGLFRLPKDMPRQKTGVIPLLLAMVFISIAIYLSTGLNGKPLAKFVGGWLPPIEDEFRRAGGSIDRGPGASAAKTGWSQAIEDDFEAALQEAKTHDLPLFVDFTGYTCANCRAVEESIFTKAGPPRELLENFVMVSLHLDGSDLEVRDRNTVILKQFNVPPAMPTYLVLDPHTKRELNRWNWEGADSGRWKTVLEDVLERWKTSKKR